MKRIVYRNGAQGDVEGPYFILDTQEVKTTWHPIERGQGGGGGY
jgi:hypothetical protein